MLLIAPLVEFAHCLIADAATAQCPLGEFRCGQFDCYGYGYDASEIRKYFLRSPGRCLNLGATSRNAFFTASVEIPGGSWNRVIDVIMIWCLTKRR